MASVANHRRYCLLKSRAAERDEKRGVARAFLAKKRALAGTAWPADFPAVAQLEAPGSPGDIPGGTGYETLDEVQGADEEELLAHGLTRSQAQAVIAELESL